MSKASALVLIIDDSADTREMYAMALEHEGFRVTLAEDGPTGLALAQQQRPDIIILDLTMPRMDGFTVARRLRADYRTETIPIIVLSGFARRNDYADAIAAGANAYCAKPCLPETLTEEIRRLLRS